MRSGLSTTVVVAFGVAGLAGCSRSLLEVTSQTLLQRVTPTAELAQVFAFKEGVAMAAWAIGSALVPLLVALGGTTAAILGTGLIVPFVVVVRLRPLLLLDAAATVPVVTLALLRRLSIFRALPVPAIEGVASHAAPIEAAPGTAIVREDEHGSRYYAIVDGTVEVSARGVRRRQLGRGEGFGEIALLRDGVRTATVVALDAVRMLAIEREAFLVAVTGHGETRERAESIAAAHLAAPT